MATVWVDLVPTEWKTEMIWDTVSMERPNTKLHHSRGNYHYRRGCDLPLIPTREAEETQTSFSLSKAVMTKMI